MKMVSVTGKMARDCSSVLQRSGRLQETLTAILCSPPATLSAKDLWEIAHECAALSGSLQTAEKTACTEVSTSIPDATLDAVMNNILLTFHKTHWTGCVRTHRASIITLLRALIEHLLGEVHPTWPGLRPWCTLIGVHNALLEQTVSSADSTDATTNSTPTQTTKTTKKNPAPSSTAESPSASYSVSSSQQRPPKRISLTSLLQMLAQKRADRCCEALLEWLLEEDTETLAVNRSDWTHKDRTAGQSEHLGDTDIAAAPNCEDDNSSIEVLKALTDHMSPGGRARAAAVAASTVCIAMAPHGSHLDHILQDDASLLNALLTALAACAPAVMGVGAIRRGKPRAAARRTAWRFYQRAAWAATGTRMDHALLWWRDTAVTIYPKQAHHIKNRALRFANVCENNVPHCAAALRGLGDALTAYIGVVSWDRRFRAPLVSSWPLRASDVTEKHGRRWKGLFVELVRLCKACEPGTNFEEAPVVEQIPLLHRLDHSLHAFRVWTSARSRALAARWDIEALFRSGHADVRTCLDVVGTLKLRDTKDVTSFNSVHVAVCIKMRTKLVSEVAENISKLQGVPEETVRALAAACRTLSLASLRLTFPEARYWRRRQGQVESGSLYVHNLLEQILLPVLRASPLLSTTSRSVVCGLVLKVMCDTWLDHIYSNRVKFSELGAAQLLEDFSGVGAWLQSMTGLLNDDDVNRALLRHEVLRRCEGVARLLLRRPGERIAMTDETAPAQKDADGSADSSMPAEMYVPNQEQWLRLRASKRNTMCCAPITNYM